MKFVVKETTIGRSSCLFDGYVFVVVLPPGQSFDQKQEIRNKITVRGGKISYMVTKTCHYLVLGDLAQFSPDTTMSHIRTAKKYGVPVVNTRFLDDCIRQEKILDPAPYDCTDGYVGDPVTSVDRIDDEFNKGVVVIDGTKDDSGFRSVLTGRKTLKVWTFLDPDGPDFHADPYDVAKYAILKGSQRSNGETPFCVLEVHVSIVNESPRYCVFVHAGNIDGPPSSKNSVARRACRYCDDARTALDVYCKLHKTYANPPHSLVTWSLVASDSKLPSDVGSPQFQKMIQSRLASHMPDDHVSHLVKHLWTEAITKLDNLVDTKVSSISQETVEKADGLLREIGRRINSGLGIGNLEGEYGSLIPQKEPEALTSVRALARQHDLVQHIRDILATSEVVNLSEIHDSDVACRNNSFGCSITHLDQDTEKFSEIQELVVGSDSQQEQIEIQIMNIFEIHRPLEDAENFQWIKDHVTSSQTMDVKLMFQANDVGNFVGILSRGLLLPKVPGDRGGGIYFSDKASASIKHANRSASKGTRFMLLAEVALGRRFDTPQKTPLPNVQPEGYDSVHGFPNVDGNSMDSKVQNDEYGIFSVNQQRLRYLIEFCLPEDKPLQLCPSPVTKWSSPMNEPLQQNVKDTYQVLEDITSAKDPHAEVQWGLQTNCHLPAVLKEVHVRAKLIDLAAKVVILQLYENRSDDLVEARYVFPLDDLSAVCGFEAFINDKHVIGTVKEKREAHQTYQKAIKEGHGAYLMDQETPDVFVVSLGNVPPKATVIIKITYVTELATEGEKINFTLPANVAPWMKQLGRIEPETMNTVAINDGNVTKSSLEISIEMPFEIRSLDSSTHHILVKKTETMATVKLPQKERLDRSFQLLIGLAEIHVPRMWVERHPESKTEACMLTFYPLFENVDGLASRDDASETVIFLLDASNSMEQSGAFVHSQAIALLGLHHLRVNWTFNVILFGSDYEELFPAPQEKSPENTKLAEEFIMNARANYGNTRLLFPLRQFHLMPQPDDHFNTVLLISDGHFTDNSEVLIDRLFDVHHQSYRIFTFGIDTPNLGCNQHLLRNLANRAAGAFEVFDHQTMCKWEMKVKSQLKKAGQPVLTDVFVEWQQLDEEPQTVVQAPRHLHTLFHGARQVVYSFVQHCSLASLHAKVNGRDITTVVSTSELSKTEGTMLHEMTARAVIRDWEDGILDKDRTEHEALKTSMKPAIISLSKKYNILTSITSFVAVEKREYNSSSSAGPSVAELLERENVDKLPYIKYPIGDPESVELKQIIVPIEPIRRYRRFVCAPQEQQQPTSLDNVDTSWLFTDDQVPRHHESDSRDAMSNLSNDTDEIKQHALEVSRQTDSSDIQEAHVATEQAVAAESSEEDMACGLFEEDEPEQDTESCNDHEITDTNEAMDNFETAKPCSSPEELDNLFGSMFDEPSTPDSPPTFVRQLGGGAFVPLKATFSLFGGGFGQQPSPASSGQLFGSPAMSGLAYSSPASAFGTPVYSENLGLITMKHIKKKKMWCDTSTASTQFGCPPCPMTFQVPVPPPPAAAAPSAAAFLRAATLNLKCTSETSTAVGMSFKMKPFELPQLESSEIGFRPIPLLNQFESKPVSMMVDQTGHTYGGLPRCSAILNDLINETSPAAFDLPAHVRKLIHRGRCAMNEMELTRVQTEILESLGEDDCSDGWTEIADVFANQEKEGFFTVATAIKLIPTMRPNWIEELDRFGLKSLGEATRTAILNLVATVAVILYMLQNKYTNLQGIRAAIEEFLARSCTGTAQDKHAAQALATYDADRVMRSKIPARFIAALLYVTWLDRRRHPLVYSTLQLGANWENYLITNVLA